MRLRSPFLRLALVGLISFSTVLSAPASEEAMRALFKILKDRGSISEEEYNLLNTMAEAERKEKKEEAVQAQTAAVAKPAKGLSLDSPAVEQMGELEERVKESEARLAKVEEGLSHSQGGVTTDPKGLSALNLKSALKWFEKLRIDGYTQLRLTTNLNDAAEDLHVPADRSVDDDEGLVLRRGRFKITGHITERLFLYSQFDFFGSVFGSGGSFGLQARDLFADFSFDKASVYRARLGQSKVPFGWVNMQSSQNRAPLERPDAINSAVEGERDVGVYFLYTPKEVQERLKELTASGLKGSGDYGMVALGAFNGQGLNRSDLNGEPHWLARVTYPWKLPNGQFFETAINAYWGKYVVGTRTVETALEEIDPVSKDDGHKDRRIGVSAIWYPQPFGIEAEWNWGQSPELSEDYRTIGTGSLHGGYVQANYLQKTKGGQFVPFVRWQYYDGPRKFATNAPREKVNELDIGLEWAPFPEIELTLMYTHSFERTDTSSTPTRLVENADRLGIQVQWNY